MELLFHPAQNLPTATADLVQKFLQEAQKKQGYSILGLSGGTGPIPFYQSLSNKLTVDEISKSSFFVVDERMVPAQDPDHNATMIEREFLSNLETKKPLERNQWLTWGTHLSITDATEDFSNKLHQYYSQKTIDMAMMGLGPDGHTASLFPEDQEHFPQDSNILTWSTPIPHLGHDRVTVTFNFLLQVKKLFFYVSGEKKREMLELILKPENSHQFPASYLLHHHPQVYICHDLPNLITKK